MKTIIIATGAVIIFLAAFGFFILNNLRPEWTDVCFNDFCFEVEIAKNEAERSRGLMFRKNLGGNRGMLFIFEKEGKYPFWMKDTLISLDIIWIREGPSAGSGQVVFINKDNLPCQETYCPSIMPGQNAKYVLEINAGMAEKIGIKIGDEINLRY